MPEDSITKIRELLQTFETAMLVTRGSESPFHARPMVIARVEAGCDLWFFTGRRSVKVWEIENDERVLVVCQNEMRRYVVLDAVAKLILDRSKASELWKESYKVWFPQGVADPDLMLIRAQAHHAEYWDHEGFKNVQYLFEAAKAYLAGTRPRVREGEQHGSVNFSE